MSSEKFAFAWLRAFDRYSISRRLSKIASLSTEKLAKVADCVFSGSRLVSPSVVRRPIPEMELTDECRLYRPRRFNATTKQRFYRSRRAELAKHCGSPSRAQLILIERIVSNEWHLLRLDARMDEGELSDHAMRSRFAMENRLRLDLRDLGLKGAASKPPSLAEYLAAKGTTKAGGEQEGAAA